VSGNPPDTRSAGNPHQKLEVAMGRKPKKTRKSPPAATATVELFLLLVLMAKVGAIIHQAG